MSDNGAVIRLVCFDLGGVIIRICRSWAEGCAAAGVDVRASELRESCAQERYEAVVAYQTGRIDAPTFARTISELLRGAYSPQEIMAVHRAWLMEEYVGVAGLIDDLHLAGLETACLSNTNHTHWARMNEYPAVMKLGVRLASHELGLHKPDAAIYREAERRFGRAGDEILYFDDLVENVAGAHAAGWCAVQIDHASATNEQMRAAIAAHGVVLGTVPDVTLH